MANVAADVSFRLSSARFQPGKPIPHENARSHENLSPFLEWTEPPAGTKSFALILEDISAPERALRMWAVYDIPPKHRHLPDGRSSKAGTEALPHGINDFGHAHYDGPDLRLGGPPHTYRFRLFALDVPTLGLTTAPMAGRVLEEAKAHALAEADLTATDH
ncbi:MAG TPA: YbhB/YbcL family Raf kinase inhibitor-like protein [Alphaproteobacteria bacterium]|jgi:Raf kinase inhibitor-like YbhB/YbcL family protein|nr:YbhB/YbcL family Raf kinase inhibitor-like protein [Alphaproteobacteria bacterium]